MIQTQLNDRHTSPGPPAILARARRETPHWAGERIGAWDDNALRRVEPFVHLDYWTDQASVNVFRVVGTQHFDYQGKTWLDFLEGGKRMDLNLSLHAKRPDYYRSTERKRPLMHYVTLDGLSFYVGADGNHRTCIARFDFHYSGLTQLHGVTVNHHHVDWAFYECYRKLLEVCRERKIPATLTPFKEGIRREDTAGWKLDRYRTLIRFDERFGEQSDILDQEGAAAKLHDLTRPARRRLFAFLKR